MPTQLDQDIHRITQAVTAPGQMFELTEVTRRGVTMPAFKNAPPSVVHYFAHFCNEKKDELFIVDGEMRLTFGEIWPTSSARSGWTGSSMARRSSCSVTAPRPKVLHRYGQRVTPPCRCWARSGPTILPPSSTPRVRPAIRRAPIRITAASSRGR